MDERCTRLRDWQNFQAWRRRQMGFIELLLESFSPSPASPEQIAYYNRTFDTDGIPFAVKRQIAATRNPGQFSGLMSGLGSTSTQGDR